MREVLRRVFFLSNNPRFFIKPATRFGKPTFLFTMEPGTQKVEYACQRIVVALKQADFDPTKDFIGLTGTPGLLCLLTAVVAVNYNDVHVLSYRAKTRSYIEARLEVFDDNIPEGASSEEPASEVAGDSNPVHTTLHGDDGVID